MTGGMGGRIPGVALRINGREWNTSLVDLQIRLICLVHLALDPTGHCLGKSHDLVMVYNGPGSQRGSLCEKRKNCQNAQHVEV